MVLDLSEVGEGGDVPTIKLVNRSNRMVFLMAGEMLVGCKQDRVLNTSIMAPAEKEMQIPVTCVEAGRWRHTSRSFGSGGSSSHSTLRMMMSMQTSASYMAEGRPTSDQGAGWEEIHKKMSKMGSSSGTGALREMYQDYAGKTKETLDHLTAPDDCSGVAFAINGRIVGADLFDKPATLAKLWVKLTKSFAMDAFERSEKVHKQVTSESVIEWLKSAGSSKLKWFDSPGEGQDVRVKGERLVGATLVVNDSPVHTELFHSQRE